MKEQPDEVYLSKRRQVELWPVELAEKLRHLLNRPGRITVLPVATNPPFVVSL